MTFALRPIQQAGWDFITQGGPRKQLNAGMGTGKTSLVLHWLSARYGLMGDSSPTLIVGPKRVAQHTWPDEIRKWPHLSHLEIATVVGDQGLRVDALKRDVPLVAVNYDNLPWLRDWYAEQRKPWPYRRVIADEVTRVKSFRLTAGSVRGRALAQFAHKDVKEWLGLTGTPMPNSLADLWAQAWFIDRGARLGPSFGAFENRWFHSVRNEEGYYMKTPTAFAQRQIMERLADVFLTLDAKDYFDLREPIVNEITVDLPASARRHYDQMEKEFFTEFIGGESVEAFNAGVKTSKCLQCASGVMFLDAERYGQGKWIEVHDAKLQALESIIEEANGMPVLVAHQWAPNRQQIMRSFKGAVDLATDEGLRQFKAGKARIGLAHPRSLGHGVDGLQEVTNQIVFFSNWWNREEHDQIIERVGPMRQLQAGKDRPVFVHYINARDTLDQAVAARNQSKKAIEAVLLDYFKRK